VVKLNREQTISLAALFLVLLACALAPIWSLKMRSDALQELTDDQDMLERLEAAHQRSGNKPGARGQITAAPTEAFLSAQTSGLASAQLEAYLSQLVLDHRATLISSSVQQANRSDASDVVHVQASLEMPYEGLQALLYKLETGTPYVFVDSMSVEPASAATQRAGVRAAAMKVTLSLRAVWHRNPA
jgi:general secretion pathway protein M